LLQELALKENNYELAELDLKRIQEEPVERISRKIRDDYWNELTRTIDKGLMQILEDEKTSNEIPTLYVSSKDKQGVKYFQDLENELGNFKVGVLPEDYSDEYIETLNTKPGILALHLSKNYTVCKVFLCGSRWKV
jgi:alpha,alpha-trehalase